MATATEWLTRDEVAKFLGVSPMTVPAITRGVKKKLSDRAAGQVGQLPKLFWYKDVEALKSQRATKQRRSSKWNKKPTANQRKIENANAHLEGSSTVREVVSAFIDKVKHLDPTINEVSVLLHRTEEFQK